jgi:pimeloyl-ACP methyl ester carboxylesterase
MTSRTKKRAILTAGGCVLLGLVVVVSQLPAIGAGLILHPPRRSLTARVPLNCEAVTYQGSGVNLEGWCCEAVGRRRGTLVYLHGFADSRGGGAGIMESFRERGFDVVAYDSRAHGESGGEAVTYGYFEKEDLRRVLDTLRPGPVVLLGSSLGAAVALQLAAEDRRVSAVVAAETFSDLRTIVTERAPFFCPAGIVSRAIEHAGAEAGFPVDAASPIEAARRITCPVLMIHGEADRDTGPDHTKRVFEALTGPKRLILVAGAGHSQSLQGDTWREVEDWIDATLTPTRLPGE